MKKQRITPDMIKEATIHYVAEHGLENVTTRKVALSMEISEGTIFNNFPSKKALLVECLYYIDAQIDSALKDAPLYEKDIVQNIHALWFAYFHYFLDHGAYVKFYRQFHQSAYYNEEVMAGQIYHFSFFTAFIHENAKYFKFNPMVYWAFLIESTLNFAVQIIDRHLPGSAEDIEHIYNLISYGFMGNLNL